MDTFDDVFSAFGGPAKYAEATRVDPVHAQTMKTRRSIPPAYWLDTVAAAERLAEMPENADRRIELRSVTLEALAELARSKRPVSEPERAA